MTSPPVRTEELRNLLLEEIRDSTSGRDLPVLCSRLGLPMQRAEHLYPTNSKGTYVKALLAGLDLNELAALARRFVDTVKDSDRLQEQLSRLTPRGMAGDFRQLIFASTGNKPKIVLADAVNNIVEIVENAGITLIYNQPLGPEGLTWRQLVDWWRTQNSDRPPADDAVVADDLFARLRAAIPKGSPPAQLLFDTYRDRCKALGPAGLARPALIPEVYLHYDPRTQPERRETGTLIESERMDFLFLLPNRRIVLEVDGIQHYTEPSTKSDDEPDHPARKSTQTASPRVYGETMAKGRRLQLRGYELYRFGGSELHASRGQRATRLLNDFFTQLLD